MKKKLLIISQSQFGSLTDYYQYSLILKSKYDIEYVCYDYNKIKVGVDGISIFYVPRTGNIIKRNISFIKYVLSKINSNSYDRILVNYFRGCFFLPLFCGKLNIFFLDIRTAGVQENNINRFFYNFFLRLECFFYKNLSVISQGVKKQLNLPDSTIIIPLGANFIDVKRQYKSGLHLLYIGTLSNRNIEQTLEGVQLFLEKYRKINFSYTIIGTGDAISINKIEKIIENYQLQSYIKMLGYIPYWELGVYFKECNLGVSYVPKKKYFEHQPVTKTFEYLMSGLPVIATSTFENKLIVNDSNGVLIEDNPNSFAMGLDKIYKSLDSFDSNSIKSDLIQYQWKNIVIKMDEFLFKD